MLKAVCTFVIINTGIDFFGEFYFAESCCIFHATTSLDVGSCQKQL